MIQRPLLLLCAVALALILVSGAAFAYDVSGTVGYEGSRTGRIYITLEHLSPYGGSGQVYGVSIPWPGDGTFTVHGLKDGNYALKARLDVVGIRELHASDPTGNISIEVTGGNVSNADVTLVDPTPVAPAPPTALNVMPSNGSNFIMWNTPQDQNNVLGTETFDLYWSTDPSFLASWPTVTAEGSISGIKASRNDNFFIHSGLTNDTIYYYVMTGATGTLVSAGTATAAMAPAAPLGGYEVSGTITASGFDPSGSTLFAILYSDTLGVYYSVINDPVSSQTYTVAGVPDGTFYVYPIYDMNGNGLMDAGDVQPGNGPGAQVTVSGGNRSDVNVTLSGATGSARASTSHWKRDNGCSEGYNIYLRAEDGTKRIANASLTSSPTNSFVIAGSVDLGLNQWGELSYWAETGRPTVGDSFDFAVEYTDGTTATLSAAFTAVLDDFPTAIAPLGVIVSEPTPTFSWSLSTSPAYNYTYQLYMNGPNTRWDAWDMPSSQLSAAYASVGEANPSTLAGNAPYDWSISLRDDDGNEAQTQARFSMGSGISGTVTDGSSGIGCVRVAISNATSTGTIGESWTNSDGTYALGGFGEGSYKVQFDGSSAGYTSEYYNNKAGWDEADAVTVIDGAVTPGVNGSLDQAGSISGHVDDGSNGIENIWVEVYSATTDSFVAGGSTDAGGNYAVNGLATGSYIIRFNGNGYVGEWYNNVQDRAAATAVGVTAGSNTPDINASLAQGGSIAGQVTDGATGIPNVYVYVCKYEGPSRSDCTYGYGGTNTDTNGSYALTGLPAGQYEVAFHGSYIGYNDEWYDNSPDQTGSALVSVATGSTTAGINAVLAETGSISGRVTNGTTGVASAAVNVVDAVSGSYVQSTMTDTAGYYTITGIAAGSYKVSFSADGYNTEWYNNKATLETANTVSVTGGMMTTGIDAALSPVGVSQNNDILWRNTATGLTAVWNMDGSTKTTSAFMSPALYDLNWKLVGNGDFNGDGNRDFLWRNAANGQTAVWYMNGAARTGSAFVSPALYSLSWQVAGTGDFNLDGKADIVWRNTATGQNAVWYMNGATMTSSAYLPVMANLNWTLAGVADFNGDGKPDLLWRNTSNGQNAVWYMDGVARTSSAYFASLADQNWQIVGAGDFNGDMNTDILWRNASTGQTAIWYLDGTTTIGTGTITPALTDPNWTIAGF